MSWVVFERALYHPTVRARLSRHYRRRWGHPRRHRVLTQADLTILALHLRQRVKENPSAQLDIRTQAAN